jgi:gamma-glutamyltranspeptidase
MIIFHYNFLYYLLKAVLDELISKGHSLQQQSSLAVVNALSREADGRIYAYADNRKDGGTAGF